MYNRSFIRCKKGGDCMARKKDQEITCEAIYTEGCGERLTKALVDVYYRRKELGIDNQKENTEDVTA